MAHLHRERVIVSVFSRIIIYIAHIITLGLTKLGSDARSAMEISGNCRPAALFHYFKMNSLPMIPTMMNFERVSVHISNQSYTYKES